MYKITKPFVVLIFGTAGVGKSTVAEFLKNQISNTVHVSADHITRYISEFREIPSHNQVSRKVTNVMIAEYIKNGINVIVDQGMDRNEIEQLKEIADDTHAEFFIYRIEADPAIQLERLKERALRVHQPVMSQETMDMLLKIYEENDYPSTETFDSGVLSTEKIANSILKGLLKI